MFFIVVNFNSQNQPLIFSNEKKKEKKDFI